MAFEHNFSVGKPDNLVYVNALLDLLEEKLEKMVRNLCDLSNFYPKNKNISFNNFPFKMIFRLIHELIGLHLLREDL